MVSLLVAPIFVFLFLKKFGTNQFDLPVYYPDGNPISDCRSSAGAHTLSDAVIAENQLQLPALFYVSFEEQNEYISDFENVLAKYPRIKSYKIQLTDSGHLENGSLTLRFKSDEFLAFINCELVFGEDKWLANSIPFKYALVDTEGSIRGYFATNKLDDIERLDTELDILINY